MVLRASGGTAGSIPVRFRQFLPASRTLGGIFPCGTATSGDECVHVTYDRLDWKQISCRFPDQWVVVTGIDWVSGSSTEIASAVVISRASSRDAAIEAARPALRMFGGEFACLFTTRWIFESRPDGRPSGRC